MQLNCITYKYMDLIDPGIVEFPGVCTGSCNDHLWSEEESSLMEFVVVDGTSAGIEFVGH